MKKNGVGFLCHFPKVCINDLCSLICFYVYVFVFLGMLLSLLSLHNTQNLVLRNLEISIDSYNELAKG